MVPLALPFIVREDINEAAGVVETLRPAFKKAIDAEK